MKNLLTLITRSLMGLSICLSVCLLISTSVSAQPLNETLYDYGTYYGNYYLRTKIHFVETTSNQWLGNFTSTQLQERADGMMENLNREYNKHGIYLVSADGTCAEGAAYNAISHPGASYSASDLNSHLIDIFDFGNENGPNCLPALGNTLCGMAGGTPSRYFSLWGSYYDPAVGGDVPTGHTAVAIHEMGHVLGLLHTYRGLDGDPECADTDPCPTDWPSSTASCQCCGDQVCDTPPTPSQLIFETDCTLTGLNEAQIKNYMNGALPNESNFCRDRFTAGQAKRMRAYLELSTTLSSVLEENGVAHSGNLPAGVYSDIIVKSGTTLSIYSTVEMLPDASIKVEKGARLNVFSTITGACGQMWQGVIVDGETTLPQNAQNQGRVVMNQNGKIEHARCAISLHDIKADGSPRPGSGGGYVWIIGGTLENNLLGLRFGPYTYSTSINANKVAGNFLVTDDIRDNAQTPVFIEASDNARLWVSGSKFQDLRTDCAISIENESDRAWGIILMNAGMTVWGCTFENLETGIWADEIDVSKGSFFLKSNQFDNCYTSVLSHGTGSFSIRDNDFFIKKPEDCPDNYRRITGIQMEGNTPGFTLMNNQFFSDDPLLLDIETLNGINASGTGAGMDNVVFKNKFSNLDIGNRAEGVNADFDFGLLYLCNTNINCYDDFIVTASGKIQEEQKDLNPDNDINWPTGNVFSDLFKSFTNLGPNTVQYFYTDEPDQEPPPNSFTGIALNFVNEPNGNCADLPPCYPPCYYEATVDAWKQQFYEDKQEWATRVANMSALTDSLQIVAAKDTIGRYRARMNRNANLVLQQFSLDTTTVFESDSIVHWLALTETYPADLRLARHYFFSQNLAAFDTLWSQIPAKYSQIDYQSGEFNELGYVYDLVRPHLQPGGPLSGLPESAVDSLKIWGDWCSEPGFLAQSLLFRNGIFVKPDCSSGPGERSSDEDRGAVPPVVQATFKVYPNPVAQMLAVESESIFGEGVLKLIDFQGRVVLLHSLPFDSYLHSLDLNGISPGIYFLQIQPFNGRSEQVKVIVTR